MGVAPDLWFAMLGNNVHAHPVEDLYGDAAEELPEGYVQTFETQLLVQCALLDVFWYYREDPRGYAVPAWLYEARATPIFGQYVCGEMLAAACMLAPPAQACDVVREAIAVLAMGDDVALRWHLAGLLGWSKEYLCSLLSREGFADAIRAVRAGEPVKDAFWQEAQAGINQRAPLVWERLKWHRHVVALP